MTATRLNPAVSSLLTVNSVNVTVPSTGHGQNAVNCTANCAKSGYTALGVVGWNMASGTRQNFLNVWRCYLSAANTVRVDVCNLHSTDAASATVAVYVLYAKN